VLVEIRLAMGSPRASSLQNPEGEGSVFSSQRPKHCTGIVRRFRVEIM
jgi:hypothetical protein